MYLKFFDLQEYPFTSSINPKYFVPAKSHKEALLHLQYSVLQGEGFSLITGDEGSGKTMTCRAFTECPDEQVSIAFISYSMQNPKKLLHAICNEFGIEPKSKTLKDLTDAFNYFLMKKRSEGKRVVVFVDDAHKYGKDVLEQLRLLSNLETTREKLLQIVLIGPPELSDMLNSHDLRPLGQRVTVSYHLRPLSENETFQYIVHRIAIAGIGVSVKFESSAVRQIYQYSGGIPQKINSACDKTLMLAFKLRNKHVSGEIVKAAINDLRSRRQYRFQISTNRAKLIGYSSALILALGILGVILFRGEILENKPQIDRTKIPESPSNRQSLKNHQAESDNINLDEPEKVKPDPSNQIQNTDREETNGRSDILSSQNTYSIQVGAYRLIKNAHDKIATLNEKGYAARIVNFEDSAGQIWYTVRIGNYGSKELAQEDAKILLGQDGVKAVVLPSDKF